MQNEYEKVFEKVKNIRRSTREGSKPGETYERKTDEMSGEFKSVIEALIRLKGINIDIAGLFIYVTGETKANKDALKQAGCWYSSQKQAWYWKPKSYKSTSRGSWSMGRIYSYYGRDTVKNAENDDDQKAIA